MWIKKEIGNLSVRNDFGGSLEGSRQLHDETLEFQKDTNVGKF